MRYLVIVQRDVCAEEIWCPEFETNEDYVGLDPDEVHHQEVSKVILCADTRAVARAIQANPGWCLFEVMPDGTTRQRAVVMKMDGRMVYDVEVS